MLDRCDDADLVAPRFTSFSASSLLDVESDSSSHVSDWAASVALSEEFCMGDPVRLHGLKMDSMNNRVGVISEYSSKSKRFSVLLHGSDSSKSFMKSILRASEPLLEDVCISCKDR